MPDETDFRLQKYIDAIRYRYFNQVIRGIFPRIGDLGKRVLAIQRYMVALNDDKRGQSFLDERQVMSAAEFKEWKGSEAFEQQNRELREIRRRFETANPGHRLVAGSQFRSMDAQISNWRKNWSVDVHAPKMLARARDEIGKTGDYPDLGGYLSEGSGLLTLSVMPMQAPGMITGMHQLAALGLAAPSELEQINAARAEAVARFARWLGEQRTGKPSLMVATPGLSSHGVGQAIDFQVHKVGGAQVVGAGGAEAWRSTGWAAKLADAVRPSRYFSGPLKSPDEPWHWTFDPTP